MDLSLIHTNLEGQISYNNQMYQMNVRFPKERGIFIMADTILIENITSLDDILAHLGCHNIKINYLNKPQGMSGSGLLFIPITLFIDGDPRKVRVFNPSVLFKLVKKGTVESVSIALDNVNVGTLHGYVTDITIAFNKNYCLYKIFFSDLPKADQRIIITLYLVLERVPFINRDVIEYILDILYPI